MFGSKESKDEKKAMKEQALMEKYGLTEMLDPVDRESVRKIAYNLTANNFMLAGSALRGKTEEVAMISMLQTIVEQNFIIIRQLDKLNNKGC